MRPFISPAITKPGARIFFGRLRQSQESEAANDLRLRAAAKSGEILRPLRKCRPDKKTEGECNAPEIQ